MREFACHWKTQATNVAHQNANTCLEKGYSVAKESTNSPEFQKKKTKAPWLRALQTKEVAAWLIKNATSVSLLNSLMPVLYVCIAILLTPECDVLLLILFCHPFFFVSVMVCHGLPCKCGSTVFFFFFPFLFFALNYVIEQRKESSKLMARVTQTIDGKENWTQQNAQGPYFFSPVANFTRFWNPALMISCYCVMLTN